MRMQLEFHLAMSKIKKYLLCQFPYVLHKFSSIPSLLTINTFLNFYQDIIHYYKIHPFQFNVQFNGF